MKNHCKTPALLALATLLALPVSGLAHHSQSEFSRSLPLDMKGTVTELDWRSPHARLFIDVVGEDGEVENWDFEMPSPNTMMRRGWTRRSLSPGQVVSVTGYRARNHDHIALITSVRDENGAPLFTGATPVFEAEPGE